MSIGVKRKGREKRITLDFSGGVSFLSVLRAKAFLAEGKRVRSERKKSKEKKKRLALSAIFGDGSESER